MLLLLLACATTSLPSGTTPAGPSSTPYGPAPVQVARSLEQAPTDGIPVVQTPTGLKYWVLREGDGAVAENGQTVSVHYTGWLADGTKFDSSVDRGQPLEFVLGQGRVIKGWEQGVVGMKIGERRRLEIPPSLGYGDRGAGGRIPPGATLVFEVELLGVR